MVNKMEKDKIKGLLKKYNSVLLESMRNAISEDFINLVILNDEDKGFDLQHLIKEKTKFKDHVMREFLKQNSSSVLEELKEMDKV
jgi:hypothetical protein